MGEVVALDCVTTIDLPPDRILENAKGAYESLIILGYDKDGDIEMRGTIADGGNLLWLLRQCERRLLDAADGIDG